VDTPEDLLAALRLGVGPHTARAAVGWLQDAAVTRLTSPTGPLREVSRQVGGTATGGATLDGVQATVNRFDPATGSGSVVTDDGLVVPFTAEAFATSGLRLVRPGQRLGVTVAGEGAGATVTVMWLESVGLAPSRPYRP